MVPDRRSHFLIRTAVGIAVRHGAENGTGTERRLERNRRGRSGARQSEVE